MLGNYFNFNVYNDSDKLRIYALIATSLIPSFLLFSRVIADSALTIVGILFLIGSIKNSNYSWTRQPSFIILFLLWIWFIVNPSWQMPK